MSPDRPDYTWGIDIIAQTLEEVAMEFAKQTTGVYTARDWAAAQLVYRFAERDVQLAPGGSEVYTFFTVAEGRTFYWSSFNFAPEGDGRAIYSRLQDGVYTRIGAHYAKALDSKYANSAIPLPVEAGGQVLVATISEDAATQWYKNIVMGWETAASKPPLHKAERASELYREGGWNYMYCRRELDGVDEVTLYIHGYPKPYRFKARNLNKPDEEILPNSDDPVEPKALKLLNTRLKALEVVKPSKPWMETP